MKPIRKDEIEYLSNYIDKKFKSRRSALESEREVEVDRTTDKNLPAFKSKLNVEKLLKTVVQLEKEYTDYRDNYDKKLTDIDHPALNVLREDLGDKVWRTEVAKAFQVSKLSKIDMAAYVYGLGDFLLPHDDQVENRVIAYSLHLTPDLEEEDGGSLDLFEED